MSKYKIDNFTMTFENNFNEPFDYQIIVDMQKVRKIVFNSESEFNQPINNMPGGIHIIIFGNKFNQPVCCQKNGHEFGCDCSPILPITLRVLKFGSDFNHYLPNLPRSLMDLSLGENFNKEFRNLPNGLKFLEFGDFFNKPICSPLLKYNRNYSNYSFLPNSLETLIFGDFFNKSICCDEVGHEYGCSCPKKLPDSIKILKFGLSFDKPLSCRNVLVGQNLNNSALPINLQTLEFGFCFNHPVCSYVNIILPQNLKILKFGNYFNQPVCCPIEGHEYCNCLFRLPRSLEYLEFGIEFNHPLHNLPALKTLIMGVDFNHPLSCQCERKCCCLKKLPMTLNTLIFNEYSKYCYGLNNLPSSLKYISMGKKYHINYETKKITQTS